MKSAPATLPSAEISCSTEYVQDDASETLGRTGSSWSIGERIFVLLSSALFLILAIASIRTQSLTDNESLFISSGLSYLQEHDGRMDIEEPPLMKILGAIPVMAFHPRVDYTDSSWTAGPGSYDPEYKFGAKFFEVWNRNHRAMLFAARLPMILLTLSLGLTLYYMARRLTGPWGAAVTLSLFVTSPFFLSYGSIVHMDIAIALFSIWTMWSFASLWEKPTKKNGFLFALSLAVALVTKFSAVFLLPAILLAWIWFRFQGRNEQHETTIANAANEYGREKIAIGAILLSGVIVCLIYAALFYRTDVTTMLFNEAASMGADGHKTIPMDVFARRMENHPALEPFLFAPSLYIGGLAYVLGHGSRPFFFMGHTYPHGVWFYFPVVSFFKLAPGMILLDILLVSGGVWALLRFPSRVFKRWGSLDPHLISTLCGLVVFAAIAMASNLNIGVRHFSAPIAILLLLCAFIEPLIGMLASRRARLLAAAGAAILVLSSLGTAMLTYPDYLAYFNLFRRNMPKQEIAENSNLNWGQASEETAAFFRARGVSSPYVVDISVIDPTIFIPGARVWKCNESGPKPGDWIAVSAYHLTYPEGKCLNLEKYPSWSIGSGAVVAFQVR